MKKKTIKIRPPPREPVAKKPRMDVKKTDVKKTAIDNKVKKLFTSVFDNKTNNCVREMCNMLFGSISETNEKLRDFLMSRSMLIFSERTVDFFFKKISPYCTRDFVEKFKLQTDAPRTVKIILSSDTNNGTIKRKTTPPCETDIELYPHMPDTHNVYNYFMRQSICTYVKTVTGNIVEFFRNFDDSIIILICIRKIKWLHKELVEDEIFSRDIFNKLNACIIYEKKN